VKKALIDSRVSHQLAQISRLGLQLLNANNVSVCLRRPVEEALCCGRTNAIKIGGYYFQHCSSSLEIEFVAACNVSLIHAERMPLRFGLMMRNMSDPCRKRRHYLVGGHEFSSGIY
jgi:hypothetical protein